MLSVDARQVSKTGLKQSPHAHVFQVRLQVVIAPHLEHRHDHVRLAKDEDGYLLKLTLCSDG